MSLEVPSHCVQTPTREYDECINIFNEWEGTCCPKGTYWGENRTQEQMLWVLVRI